MSSGTKSQPRRLTWTWTYRDLPPGTWWGSYYGTFVGAWETDDDREDYKYICVHVTHDGRFCPLVPYLHTRTPEFGHSSDFPKRATLKEAIAFCETYLAKDTRDW